ncbi:MAG: type IV pilus modification protein PilV [Gammaproteobacteria bacterium]|nr:type IV pilus modification protein PilV [Gammaproteobacteria bacterium]
MLARVKQNRCAKPARIEGFTLIEVLIALVIMSVGMLGIAGLYVHSMQAGRTSMLRHHAITLAGDVADRIRANPRAGAVYALAGANNNCVAGGIDCTPAEMAGNDIFIWNQQAAATLPNGNVVVVFDNGVVPPTYQITVSWTEPGEVMSYAVTIPVFGI